MNFVHQVKTSETRNKGHHGLFEFEIICFRIVTPLVEQSHHSWLILRAHFHTVFGTDTLKTSEQWNTAAPHITVKHYFTVITWRRWWWCWKTIKMNERNEPFKYNVEWRPTKTRETRWTNKNIRSCFSSSQLLTSDNGLTDWNISSPKIFYVRLILKMKKCCRKTTEVSVEYG